MAMVERRESMELESDIVVVCSKELVNEGEGGFWMDLPMFNFPSVC